MESDGTVSPARVLAALEVLGWPDDRQGSAHGEDVTPSREYWDLVVDVIRAADGAHRGGAVDEADQSTRQPVDVDTPVRQPAYDAIYTLIRALGDHMPASSVHRNALIWRAVETALDAMDESGRLLPPGGEVSEEWSARWTPNVEMATKGYEVEQMPAGSRERAESLARRYGNDEDGTVELLRRRKYVGPWSPVVSDTSEVPSG